jgi:phenylalanyl-tRNA synthetase beta chain
LNLGRMAALLGVDVPRAEVGRRLTALGAKVSSRGKGKVVVQVPSFRPDLREAADLAEEVARLSGLEEIPERLPPRPIGIAAGSHARQLAAAVRETMAGCGLTEIRTIAFTAPEDNELFPGLKGHPPVVVANPLSAELSELRSSLLPGLINALRFNLNRQANAFHAFELAKVFAQESGGPHEMTVLGGVSYGEWLRPGVSQGAVAAGFFTVKGIVETLLQTLGREGEAVFEPMSGSAVPYLHPGKSAEIKLQGQALGLLGELHPQTAMRLDLGLPCAIFELDFSLLVALGRAITPIVPPPRFPAIRRDLALVLDRATAAGQVVETIRQLNVQWLESVEVFDVYTGEGITPGKKSLALALRYRAKDRTLTDDEINRTHDYLIRQATQRLNAQLRQ